MQPRCLLAEASEEGALDAQTASQSVCCSGQIDACAGRLESMSERAIAQIASQSFRLLGQTNRLMVRAGCSQGVSEQLHGERECQSVGLLHGENSWMDGQSVGRSVGQFVGPDK